MRACRPLFPAVCFCDNAYEAARGADALVICTEWNQFRKLELDRLHALLRRPLVVDLRNLYAPEKMAAASFEYISIGRPVARPDAEPAAAPTAAAAAPANVAAGRTATREDAPASPAR